MEAPFEWDRDKAEANRRKHGVTFSEARTVFSDPLAITLYDFVHSTSETRYLLLGRSAYGRVLLLRTPNMSTVFA